MSYLSRLDIAAPNDEWPLVRDWLINEPIPFTAELRAFRPVLKTPVATLVSRYSDVQDVLRRHETFGNDLYAPKQAPYWMPDNDTARHWREKSVMKAILDKEDVPDIRAFVGTQTAQILGAGNGTLDLIPEIGREVPLRLVQSWFGFDGADRDAMFTWSYWNQVDAFKNQPMDQHLVTDPGPDEIVRKRLEVSAEMRAFIDQLVARRENEIAGGNPGRDPVTRLVQLQRSGSVRINRDLVILNVGGLLIGAIETTSEAVAYALSELTKRPETLDAARSAAAEDDPAAFDGYVWEALRFRPIAPYIFRKAIQPARIGLGRDYATDIANGEIVLACIQSAYFDPTAYDDPEAFRTDRPFDQAFHFGEGLHDCLGRNIGRVMVPEILRQCLRQPDFAPTGPINFKGEPFPASYPVRWTV